LDQQVCVLVADYYNNRIIALNPSLTAARQLPLPVDTRLQSPFALCFDESRGRLYVGENVGQRRVLVFDNVNNINAMFRQ
jgi:DNA-binding beta-propeller fold protein YncE